MKTRLIRDEPHFLATGSNFWIRTFLFRSLLSEDLEEERLGKKCWKEWSRGNN